MADEATRADILKMIKGLMREMGTDVIRQVVKDGDWLDSRLKDYLIKNPIQGLVEWAIRDHLRSDTWFAGGLTKHINDFCEGRINALAVKFEARIVERFEKRVNEMVTAELRNRLRL